MKAQRSTIGTSHLRLSGQHLNPNSSYSSHKRILRMLPNRLETDMSCYGGPLEPLQYVLQCVPITTMHVPSGADCLKYFIGTLWIM